MQFETMIQKAERFIRSAEILAEEGDFDQALVAAFSKRQLGDYAVESGLKQEDIDILMVNATDFLSAARKCLAGSPI